MSKTAKQQKKDIPTNASKKLAAIRGFLDADAAVDQKLIGNRVRLGILSALSVSDDMTFAELKQLLSLTDGNLSVHARKLEDAGLVACTKGFDNRTPKTNYAITARGAAALERYLSHMEALIQATNSTTKR
ncbi:MAG: transcriptional regulator [Pseudomonadaceae bacterium]|nr:transcriptional regulator [Pseudomonadaceae bacterium]